MARFIAAVLSGFASGGIYSLLAIAFSIIYMTTRVINFAQGDVMMVAAYVYFLAVSKSYLGLPWPAALLIALIAGAIVAMIVYIVALAPLGKFDPNTNIGWILTTLAVSLILVELARLVFGEQQKTVAPVIKRIGSKKTLFQLTPQQYLVIVIGIVLALILEVLHSKTQLGRALRATAHDKATASLMGIDTNFMVRYSFLIAGVLAGVAGWLLAPIIFVSSNMGTLVGLKAFIAAVVGGIGSTRAALVGGMTIGMVEQLSIYGGAGEWTNALVFITLIVILLVRPTGLLGEALIEKV
ncbi:MAG: branched-chain amino acid ABC transporter permease [Actinomycetota bacterium]|nr:branched-chain amino acid ABC transporter permease [Actinomycetota bacterium]